MYVNKGLEALKNIPVLTVSHILPEQLSDIQEGAWKYFLGVMKDREYALFRKNMPVAESLEILASFHKTGIKPTASTSYTSAQQDTWVKELLGYRLLDIMAQVYGMGVEERNKEKSLTPLNLKLVRHRSILHAAIDIYLRAHNIWMIGPG